MHYKHLTEYDPNSVRTVLVTGGTGSLGSALVERLHDKGWNVIFQYFGNEELASVCKKKQNNDSIRGFHCDLSGDTPELETMMTTVINAYPAIDAFIHCATPPVVAAGFTRKSAGELRKHIEIHVSSFIKILEFLLPGMQYRQTGVIIGILSEAIFPLRIPGWSAYTAAKMALGSVMTDLSQEAALTNTRVVGVLPGAFQVKPKPPAPHQNPIEYHTTERVRRRWPMGLPPLAVAELILDILDNAPKHPNGAMIAIDPQSGIRNVPNLFSYPQDGPSSDGMTEDTEKTKPQVIPTAPNDENEKTTEDPVTGALAKIFRKVFKLKEDENVWEASLNTLTEWSSLTHIELLMEIEQDLDVDFSSDEGVSLTSFQSILASVRQKIQAV